MSIRSAQGGVGHHPFAGMLWMALASTLFALMNIFARLASAKLPWAEVAAARTSVAAMVALGIAFARRAPLTIHDKPKAWARSLFGTASMACIFYTISAPEIALGDAVTLSSITPIFIALLSPWLLGEASGRWVWLATALATVGVALVAGAELRIAREPAMTAMLGAFFSALAMIWLRKLRVGAPSSAPMPQSAIGAALGRSSAAPPAAKAGESPEAIVVHFSVVSSVVMIALAVPSWRAPDAGGAALLAATGLTGGLAQLAMTRAYALERAARLGTMGYLGVVLSHLLGIAVLGERPRPEQMLGTALVVGAGVLLALLTLRDARIAERRAAAITG